MADPGRSDPGPADPRRNDAAQVDARQVDARQAHAGHADAARSARGLSAAELRDAVAELQALAGARVVDAVPLHTDAGTDDLLLVLQPTGGDRSKLFLHIALGSRRARLHTTARRFGKDARARSPAADLLLRELGDTVLTGLCQPEGERRCELGFTGAGGDRTLAVELFGSRGLWALLDAGRRIVLLSRPVETAVRTLRPDGRYEPPPPAGPAPDRAGDERRFAAPVLPAIDAWFTAIDTAIAFAHEHERLAVACRRALQRARTKAAGLRAALAEVDRAATLRHEADLMLAFAHTVPRGAAAMAVPDPEQDGAERRIELDPAQPVVAQAQRRYEKARRLDDGRATTERRLAEADAAVTALAALVAELGAAATLEALVPPREQLQRLGALPKPRSTAPARPRAPAVPSDENYRRFTSAEGYTILVGRDNEQNDRLTMRTANGNDLWLHVGGGRAGSHVVIRLPRGKTASLEMLLDAATLAVHFSKARGEARIDVVYTQRKHVRKPRGLPPGSVVPAQTRTVTVRADAERLRRLLASGAADSD